jgi:type IV secretory pathway VirB10-like protein
MKNELSYFYKVAFLFAALTSFSLASASAQSYMFMDDAGNIFHVDSPYKVPKEYRDQVIPEKPQPELTKKQYTRLQRDLEREQKKKLKEEKKKQDELEKARKKKLKKLEKERKKERLREQKEQKRSAGSREKTARRGVSDLEPPSDIFVEEN